MGDCDDCTILFTLTSMNFRVRCPHAQRNKIDLYYKIVEHLFCFVKRGILVTTHNYVESSTC